jgi:hypothetical protein
MLKLSACGERDFAARDVRTGGYRISGNDVASFLFLHNYHGDNGIAVCYVLFRFAITKWNLRTPGREPDTEFEAHEDANLSDAQEIS